MELIRIGAQLSVLAIALGVCACTKQPASGPPSAQSTAGAPGAATASGIRDEDRISAGGVLPQPTEIPRFDKADPNDGKSGEALFASMNCDGCHGGGALGWVGPSLVDGRWRYGGADDEVFASIYYGRPKGMPAYGGVIGAEGVRMLVAYVKSQSAPSVVPTTNYEELSQATAAAPVKESGPSTPAAPKTPEQMLAQYTCTACHAVDHKVVGPAFKDVAAKYRGQGDAEDKLAEKVRNGGSGVWGDVPMTPNPQVPEQDLHTLVKWVLAQK
jgi:cytochrome c